MINLNTIDYTIHSIVIKDSGGQELAIDAAGKIGAIVEATALDIRSLAFATDQVDVSGSSVSITGDVNVTQGTSPWVISASNLDIRNLVFADDKVDVSGSTITTLEGGYDTWTVTQQNVTTTESQIAASPLTGRLRVEIQNLSSQDLYVRQSTGVTTSNGFKIPKGQSWEQILSDGAAIYAVAASGTVDVRVAQFAA